MGEWREEERKAKREEDVKLMRALRRKNVRYVGI